MKIYGFSCLKNGIKFDYPFVESWTSISELVEDNIIAFDDGEDQSREILKKIPKVTILDRSWPEGVLGGRSISMMTNYALVELRKKYGEDSSAWAIMLQADEVLHEKDLDRLRIDLQRAEDSGCDAMSFRYHHFWQSHYKVGCQARWYPHEIRAIKLKTSILNEGDGVSFENHTKVYPSEIYIYHYGHVRDEKKYLEKTLEMRKMYYKGFRLKRKLMKVRMGSREKTLTYLGSHPKIMKPRIQKLEGPPPFEVKDTVYICSAANEYSESLLKTMNCRKIQFIEKKKPIKLTKRDVFVDMNPSRLSQVFGGKKHDRLEAPQARPWSKDTQLIFACSRQGVGFSLEQDEPPDIHS